MTKATKAQLSEANTKLKREIDAGKYNGKKHKWATNKYHSINYKIRNYDGTENKQIAKKVNKKMAKMAVSAEMQGHLPGFLDQMNNVRIEEMVREAIFKRVSTRVDEVVDRLLGGGKKHG